MTYVPVYGPCCKIVIIKAFAYRAEALEEFSHDYTFAPINTPTNDTQWLALVNAIRTQEANIYNTQVQFHRAYGYDNNDPKTPHVYLKDWLTDGDGGTGGYSPQAGNVKGAGDQAAVVQWLHTTKTAKGKPLWFRKFHHVPYIVAGGGDLLATDYVTQLQAYGNYMRTYLGGPYSTKYPTGSSSSAHVIPYVTTRTLKRRGKRLRPSP